MKKHKQIELYSKMVHHFMYMAGMSRTKPELLDVCTLPQMLDARKVFLMSSKEEKKMAMLEVKTEHMPGMTDFDIACIYVATHGTKTNIHETVPLLSMPDRHLILLERDTLIEEISEMITEYESQHETKVPKNVLGQIYVRCKTQGVEPSKEMIMI